MSKNVIKIIIAVVLIVVIAVGVFFIIDKNKDKKQNENVTEDMKKFKEEYEALNGKDNGSGNVYQTLTIPEYNLIKYSSAEEIVELMDGGTGIVYLGFPICPWCRNTIPELITAATDAGVDTIYYLDMLEVRSAWELQDGEAVEVKAGQPGYYDLLRVFASVIEPYVLTDDAGNKFETGELRIYVPLVIFIKDGEIIGYRDTTVELNEGQGAWNPLTASQKTELKNIFADLIDEMLGSSFCDETC